jgi:hypothetical protein
MSADSMNATVPFQQENILSLRESNDQRLGAFLKFAVRMGCEI